MSQEYNEEILYSFPRNGVSFSAPVTKTQNSTMINAVTKIMNDINEKAGIKENTLLQLIGCIGILCFFSPLLLLVINTSGDATMYIIIFVPILIGIAGICFCTANSRGSSCFENKRKDNLIKYLEENRASIEREIQTQGWKFNYSFNVGSETRQVRVRTKNGYRTENRTTYFLQGHIRFFNERSGFSVAPSPALQPNSMPNQQSYPQQPNNTFGFPNQPPPFQGGPPSQFGNYQPVPFSINQQPFSPAPPFVQNQGANQNTFNPMPPPLPYQPAPYVMGERADQMPPIQQIDVAKGGINNIQF